MVEYDEDKGLAMLLEMVTCPSPTGSQSVDAKSLVDEQEQIEVLKWQSKQDAEDERSEMQRQLEWEEQLLSQTAPKQEDEQWPMEPSQVAVERGNNACDTDRVIVGTDGSNMSGQSQEESEYQQQLAAALAHSITETTYLTSTISDESAQSKSPNISTNKDFGSCEKETKVDSRHPTNALTITDPGSLHCMCQVESMKIACFGSADLWLSKATN